jgi:transcriptional regulator NrdR family protein
MDDVKINNETRDISKEKLLLLYMNILKQMSNMTYRRFFVVYVMLLY